MLLAHSLAAPQAASEASPRLWGDPWVPGPSVLVKQEGPANSSHFPNGRSSLGFSPGPPGPFPDMVLPGTEHHLRLWGPIGSVISRTSPHQIRRVAAGWAHVFAGVRSSGRCRPGGCHVPVPATQAGQVGRAEGQGRMGCPGRGTVTLAGHPKGPGPAPQLGLSAQNRKMASASSAFVSVEKR